MDLWRSEYVVLVSVCIVQGEKSQTSNKTTSPSSASLSSARKVMLPSSHVPFGVRRCESCVESFWMAMQDVSPRKSRRVFENPQEVQPVSMEPPVKSEEEMSVWQTQEELLVCRLLLREYVLKLSPYSCAESTESSSENNPAFWNPHS